MKNGTVCLNGKLNGTLYKLNGPYNAASIVPIGQMVFSDYTKRRILILRERGKRTKEISELLLMADIRASNRGISKFLSRYKQGGTIVRKKGSGKNTLRCTVLALFFNRSLSRTLKMLTL